MRIVVDMQPVQSMSKNRGIGRYTRYFIQALVRNSNEHEIVLVFNGLMAETEESIYSEYGEILNQQNIRFWYPLGDVKYANGLAWRREVAELTREALISSLNPSVLLVCSLFEGYGDAVAVSVGKYNKTMPTAVILYDLIPLIHKDKYLTNLNVSAWYDERLEHLMRADLLLAISESSRLEAINLLEFDDAKVINISSAIDSIFVPKTLSEESKNELLNKYRLKPNFLMYTGGNDFRKNINGLIKAYASIPIETRINHQLLIVCDLGAVKIEFEQLFQQLDLTSNDVVFSGFVPDSDLVLLYNLSYCFIFPSLHEGFGLPVLEAMSCGKAVIGSNLTSIPEIIGDKEAMFDPYSTESMAGIMIRVLTDDSFKNKLETNSAIRSKLFSWDITAKNALKGLQALCEKVDYSVELPMATGANDLIDRIVQIKPEPSAEGEWVKLAQALTLTFPNDRRVIF